MGETSLPGLMQHHPIPSSLRNTTLTKAHRFDLQVPSHRSFENNPNRVPCYKMWPCTGCKKPYDVCVNIKTLSWCQNDGCLAWKHVDCGKKGGTDERCGADPADQPTSRNSVQTQRRDNARSGIDDTHRRTDGVYDPNQAPVPDSPVRERTQRSGLARKRGLGDLRRGL
ncbi:hypothetical protein BJ508DRAFT_311383 [Ascobolus immersus RN42]|uniref:Uncharacterized protein n=1 Tax=Ascobolus immersus RN42 TaxID=1160509 RepID=A0A3N4HQQ4_ASCIM|nr:hypothetical protein BJ508DRAFT_311383 [Ascobolus immersus RN42]